ncbi:hypothetical protein UPYG_G00155010 [Umbra pygmaea]|uniref:Syndecan n=1 Tax=Umbra pygmaea TaxID=75934 RepID=A0ABD0WYE7_UMBPY
MTNIWILLCLAWTTCFMSETMFISAQSDDLYLDDQSGDDTIDDDDRWHSGSGSGDTNINEVIEEPPIVRILFVAPEAEPTYEALPDHLTTMEETPSSTETPSLGITFEGTVGINGESAMSSEAPLSTTTASKMVYNKDVPYEVESENLFQRKEVLAAVIAGGVIGFLFAIFLILLLVYRMRKKDEGSYDLGERKAPSSAYQKAPTKEFYA